MTKNYKIALATVAIATTLTGCTFSFTTDDDNTPTDKDDTQVTEEQKVPTIETKAEGTYTNDKYGFSVEIPATWTGYTAVERPLSDEVPVIDFNLKGPQEMESMMAIAVYTKAQWAEINPDENPLVADAKIGENDKYVFTAHGSQDNSEELITKRQEVESILKTFKAY